MVLSRAFGGAGLALPGNGWTDGTRGPPRAGVRACSGMSKMMPASDAARIHVAALIDRAQRAQRIRAESRNPARPAMPLV